jgi:tetratricopeptide (TPR) repeat protein
MNKSQPKIFIFFIYLFLTVGTAVCFWQVRNFDFITLDDRGYVLENPHVTTGLKMDNIIWAFTTGHEANWHPLTWLSLMLDCQLFGPNPGRLHLENALIHLLNTLLLFALLKNMTELLWPSAFVAAAFALHPMHVESVAWIAERKDVLSTLFFLLTLAGYVGYVRRPSVFRYVVTIVLFAIGLLAKPMLVTLPFVLLLLDYWPLNRFVPQTAKPTGRQSRKPTPVHGGHAVTYQLIIEKIPFFALSAGSSVITFLVQRSSGAVVDINYISLQRRVANAFVSYATYIGELFWPTNLAIFYPFPEAGLPFWQITLCVLLLVVISIFVIHFGRRQKYLPVGWFWFVGTLVPVIGLVQVGVQAYADRYTYIPYIGLFIIIAWGLPALLAKWPYRKIALGASMLITLAALGIGAYRQASYWKNSTTLFSHALDVTKNNYLAYANLGDDLCSQGKVALAIEYYKKSLQIQPNSAYAHNNLGLALEKQGKHAEAIAHFRQAVQLMPDLAKARDNLAKALVMQGQFYEALEQFRTAIRLEPDMPAPMNDLAFQIAAHPELKGRDVNEAIHLATRACELTNYKNTAYLSTLAAVYISADSFSKAAGILETALKLEPNSATLHNGLGNALLSEGKFKEAIGEIKRSLEIEPNNPDAKNNLAWILATCPDANMRNPSDAIRLAQEACIATNYKKASKLDTLGAAFASAGRFDEAIETAQKALSVADRGQTELLKTIQGHLNLYKASKPYIEVRQKEQSRD